MKTIWKPGAMLAPVPPTLVSCGNGEISNILTVAWTGIINSDPAMTYISVRRGRYSYGIIRDTGVFVINLPRSSMARQVDLCGVRSGRDTDKFALCGFTAEPSQPDGCPSIAECPVSISCRVKSVTPLGSHDMFIAEIASVSVDDSCIDQSGRFSAARADLLAYAHGEYFSLGKRLGFFGFSVRKKGRRK
ncbi:MAG: flavin reductase family protein [Clostridiales bacterium]|nr:flavin reductase family protein [Clostridiales bacterium]